MKKHGNFKHGLCKHPIYRSWAGMKSRCSDSNSPNWPKYGGRGIALCSKWIDFLPFFKWSLENGWDKGLSIDREDNDGNYEPSNCRWATDSQQMLNRRKFRHSEKSKRKSSTGHKYVYPNYATGFIVKADKYIGSSQTLYGALALRLKTFGF